MREFAFVFVLFAMVAGYIAEEVYAPIEVDCNQTYFSPASRDVYCSGVMTTTSVSNGNIFHCTCTEFLKGLK